MASRHTDDIIEKGLGSKVQRRILRFLTSNPERGYTRYQIMKQTYLGYPECTKALKALTEIEWLRKHEGKNTTYQINAANPTVASLIEFYRKIGYIS